MLAVVADALFVLALRGHDAMVAGGRGRRTTAGARDRSGRWPG